ncbi:MAG TPA: hypothetical protein VEJ63_15830 [Planctomycetota bacterium]|nr:hypothetical protein [Planctomycetota bacterium]
MTRCILLALSIAVTSVCWAQHPQVDLEGTLIRQNGRTVLRVGDDVYALRFPSTSLMTFTNDLLGEEVRVRGTLQLRNENGGQRAVVTPERIDRLGVGSPSEESAFETSIEEPTPVERQRVTRVDRRKVLVRDDTANRDEPTEFQTRVERRKRGIRRGSDTYNYDYNETLITPGGGVIIRNR